MHPYFLCFLEQFNFFFDHYDASIGYWQEIVMFMKKYLRPWSYYTPDYTRSHLTNHSRAHKFSWKYITWLAPTIRHVSKLIIYYILYLSC